MKHFISKIRYGIELSPSQWDKLVEIERSRPQDLYLALKDCSRKEIVRSVSEVDHVLYIEIQSQSPQNDLSKCKKVLHNLLSS